MDKVFSTRLDEELVRRVDRFVKEKSMSKKRLVEEALRTFMDQAGDETEYAIIERSFGAWRRDEAPEETWSRGRRTLTRAFDKRRRA